MRGCAGLQPPGAIGAAKACTGSPPLSLPLKKFTHHVAVPPVSLQVQELALEGLANTSQDGFTDVEQLARDFALHCSQVQSQLKAMGDKVLPSAIVCRASGKAHRVANAFSTLCGWSWSSDPLATMPIPTDWERAWCRRCIIYADRLVGGASSTQGG
jgi:hypothetical protein